MHTVRVSPSAHKFLERQSLDVRDRVRTALLELAKDPLVSRRVKRLVGTDGLLRLRVGDIRVVFAVEPEELLIFVVAIGNRGDIYRRQ